MAVPPSYVDLGKSARDIFDKGFDFGQVKLKVETLASGVQFKVADSSTIDGNKVSGSLETKYKRPDYGLTLSGKWNTANKIGTEVAVEDRIAQGLKLTVGATFSPNTSKMSGQVKTAYKREYMNLGCDVNFDHKRPTILGAVVAGYDGWLAGYQMSFDTAISKMTQSNVAIGYKTNDLQVLANVNNGAEVESSIYKKVNDKLQTAVSLLWNSGNNNTSFGVAAKYQLDNDASVSAKVDNNSHVGVGYTHTLRPGMKLTLSGLLDGKSINAGGHKLGLGLELEA